MVSAERAVHDHTTDMNVQPTQETSILLAIRRTFCHVGHSETPGDQLRSAQASASFFPTTNPPFHDTTAKTESRYASRSGNA